MVDRFSFTDPGSGTRLLWSWSWLVRSGLLWRRLLLGASWLRLLRPSLLARSLLESRSLVLSVSAAANPSRSSGGVDLCPEMQYDSARVKNPGDVLSNVRVSELRTRRPRVNPFPSRSC